MDRWDVIKLQIQISQLYIAPDTVGHKFHSCGRSLKYISFNKFSFGQKRLCVLRDFVPRLEKS